MNFGDFIREETETINDFKNSLSFGDVRPDRIMAVKSAIFNAALYRTVALYSYNATKEEITKSLTEAIAAFEEGFKWEGFENRYAMYDQIIWLLSLGILCDIDNADFDRMVKIIKRDSAVDKLIAKLVNYEIPNSIQGFSVDYIQESPYANLDTVVSGVNPTAFAIKEYLDKDWYNGHSEAPWHDAHKNKKVNVFFGYWAWETAALVKIYGIDEACCETNDIIRTEPYIGKILQLFNYR